MNNIKNLIRLTVVKTATAALLAAFVFAAVVPAHAQTADVRYAGVFYKDHPTSTNEMYCDYTDWNTSGYSSTSSNSTMILNHSGRSWSMSGWRYTFRPLTVTTDGSLGLRFIGVFSTAPSGVSPRQANHEYNVGDVFYIEVTSSVSSHTFLNPGFYVYAVSSRTSRGLSIGVGEDTTENRSFVFLPTPASHSHDNDPWVSSALIEYDQPYNSSNNPTNPGDGDGYEANEYPNHCLSLCMNVTCTNKPMGASTYSLAFPLQQIRFDVVKYYNGKNVENPEETPAIRTIDLYPDQEAAKCGSYKCPGGPTDGYVCNAPEYEQRDGACWSLSTGEKLGDGVCTSYGGSCNSSKICNYIIFNGDGTATNQAIPFCAAWDGSYEIAGEFGKTNGNFAFRATVKTDVPGDNIITDKITFDSTIAYPGMNQIPIQVDVTNIHTVRSTPTLVGNITPVSAQPYTYAYRLSKDADVRVAVFDASNLDAAVYASTVAATSNTSTPIGDAGNTYSDLIVRTIADWQPRIGEGMKGTDKDVQITEFDSWDGRDTSGMLLPAGNYLVSLQAKSADEWHGIDFSRAVTRQLSLDPLKLTDVVSVGLTKQSTAYASITYTPTESSKVYWNIYTPGTTFDSVLTDSSDATGTAPHNPTGGSLVYSLIEDRVGRMNFTSKWDGLCAGNETLTSGGKGCIRTYAAGEKKSDGTIAAAGDTEEFAYGSPMPDGNYVYVLWAEIPYNGKYVNAVGSTATTTSTTPKPEFFANAACKVNASTQTASASDVAAAEIDKQCFTGVKTLKYTVGEIAVERGVVDVTIQPVSYSTVGSSPTAYGLDPFIFKYSIARDATVVAKVTNTAGANVKFLTPEEGVTQVAQQMNTISWDGRDDAGRMVTPGTYMFVVETEDAMFPAITNRASAVFPVDMYRVVDLATTDVYGDSEAKATISYALSKAMNTQVNIYNKDVVIPSYQTTTGDYSSATVTGSVTTNGYTNVLNPGTINVDEVPNAYTMPAGLGTFVAGETQTVVALVGTTYHRYTVTLKNNPANTATPTTWYEPYLYMVTVIDETLDITSGTAAWPPRVCNVADDSVYFTGGYVDPAKKPTCIYVNKTTFTNYPANAAAVAQGNVDVRLQPIKTFERSSMHPGDGLTITEEWDALYFRNPESPACAGSTNLQNCSYEMLPDGQYPFYVSARSNEPFDRYYYDANVDSTTHPTDPVTGNAYLNGTPFRSDDANGTFVTQDYLYATDKVTSKINVTRGSVYFLDGSTVVYPNAPQLFNVSSGPVFVPPYEINFSVSRAATVDIEIVALQDGVCTPDPTVHADLKNNRAGDVCKSLTTVTIPNTGHFDPNIVRKTYWDGTDNNGFYVKPAIYEVRLTAKNYPNPYLYQPTVKSITLNADLLKVFDLLEADGYSISVRGANMKIGYQISVPMKVALQIFKPGTTIYDYQKGTLRNPTTGTEVKDIHEVLVKAIVGIRPATTLIEEVWDGTDYAGQEVPDGTYPFRFVTAINSADIDSVTGEIVGEWDNTDGQASQPALWKINKVADTYEYQNLHKATIAIGDGQFVCEDWEKTVFFYPNPFTETNGTLEITKMPVPGEVSIKFFNLAGDLVRDGGYTCVDANNYQTTMGSSLKFQPDNNVSNTPVNLANFENIRNAALRCRWDKTNQHGKKVARGVYFGLVDFKAQMGREHCQKVVKVLIP